MNITTKKKISLCQPNFQQGPMELNAHYLPYSAGILWSYAQQFDEIKDNYELDQLIWERRDIEEYVELLKDNTVVGFSTYVWNRNYTYALARKLKEKNPNIFLFFGGPEIPHERNDVFETYPFMDLVVVREGEITFKNLLTALHNQTDLKEINGIVLNDNGVRVVTQNAPRIQDLEDVPSPYLTGVFDKLIAETEGKVEWNATIETNRGCPYQCTFCDWGSLTYGKVKKFEYNRVLDEIEWIGKNKCGYVTIADANFGMFRDRDNEIADKILEVQSKYNFPQGVSMTWAKNQKADVYKIVQKLFKAGSFNQGLTVSVQSMNLDVLENIKRKNLGQHNITEIFDLCNKNGIPVDTEVILGLPGETQETWKENLWSLFRLGNHTGVTIHQCQLLENAEMNLLQRKMNKLEAVPIYDYMSGSYNYDSLAESVDVVMSTGTMPRDIMVDTQVFNWFINTFHMNGLTTWISRFLHKHQSIDYSEFYEKLIPFLQQDDWFQKEEDEIRQFYNNWKDHGRINHPLIGGTVPIHGWNLIHRTAMTMHADHKHDRVFDLIEQFVRETFDLPEKLMTQLLDYNRTYVLNYDKLQQYPLAKTFDYDFFGYIVNEEPLESTTLVKFDFRENKDMTFDRFLQDFWYGRKRNFGKAFITKETIKEHVIENV